MTLDITVIQQKGRQIVVEYAGTHEDVTICRKVMIDLTTVADFNIVKEAIKIAVKNDLKQHYLVGMTFSMEADINGISKELQ